ncbi:MAG: hypothetical protein VX265_04575 [Myxococcota bacterium]|nr:hypothetical protein [Myxococcota bacterium]
MPTPSILVFIAAAHAVPGGIRPVTATVPPAPATIEELARQLDDSDRPTRLLAARELKRRVRVAAKAGGRPGSLAELEARAEMAALTRATLPACISVLSDPGLVLPCADILSRLAEAEACEPLRVARAGSERRRVTEAIDRALERLGETCPAAEK